ncbi:M56 family metallopeptidase [Actibacterium pelagium]|uniref:Peptidase M56 domain-containing protein n=1 Tax=Actibacterium pelagium TaxID=2029103 RepID=A0A917AMG9_9RHOB|nr:M56 family metallopeptidase [Actibacterium pelagium]GGE61973.1 hypothetical protein GCM10011517_32030 [Actibacterium pelagium]
MDSDALLNTYIDLNLLLLAGAMIWLALRWGLARIGLGAAFLPQLRLMNWMIIILALSPVFASAVSHWIVARPPNLSDMLVSQYLQGNVQMSASDFEALLGAREEGVRALLSMQSVGAKALLAGFFLGALFCFGQTALAVIRLRNIVSRAFHWKRIGTVNLMFSDTAKVAFSTRGLFKRYVILPSTLLQSPKDLRLTISHEIQHFRQRDIEFELLLEVLRPMLWWNPAFHIWRREVRQMREYACDQALISRPNFDARAYCECLIRACTVAAQERAYFTRRTPAVALVDRRETRRSSSLYRRILHVADGAGRPGSRASWTMVSCLLVFAVFSTAVMIQRPAEWSHDRIMLSTVVNLERMAKRSEPPVSPFQGGFVGVTD